GRGADEEGELDQWSGSAVIADRTGRNACLPHSSVSRTGSSQWEVVSDLMGDHRDVNAAWSRWRFCAANAPPRYLNLTGEEEDTGIRDSLNFLYDELEKLPPRDYILSDEAKQLFETWQHQLVLAEKQEPVVGLQRAYPKNEAYTARLALWLHVVNAVLRGEQPGPAISGETMAKAIELAAYFLWQCRLIHTHNAPDSGPAALGLKIQKYAEKVGEVTASLLKSRLRPLRNMAVNQIRQLMQMMAKAGYGLVRGEGSKMTYVPTPTDQSSEPNPSPPSSPASPSPPMPPPPPSPSPAPMRSPAPMPSPPPAPAEAAPFSTEARVSSSPSNVNPSPSSDAIPPPSNGIASPGIDKVDSFDDSLTPTFDFESQSEQTFQNFVDGIDEIDGLQNHMNSDYRPGSSPPGISAIDVATNTSIGARGEPEPPVPGQHLAPSENSSRGEDVKAQGHSMSAQTAPNAPPPNAFPRHAPPTPGQAPPLLEQALPPLEVNQSSSEGPPLGTPHPSPQNYPPNQIRPHPEPIQQFQKGQLVEAFIDGCWVLAKYVRPVWHSVFSPQTEKLHDGHQVSLVKTKRYPNFFKVATPDLRWHIS
ncbi:MAG: DUF3987 domain-containing protein, partial [Elainellaceae cyanobacterium]